MGKITTRARRNKKKTSKFQKLWQRAETLKKDIAERDQRLDQLAQRIEREIYPAERETASSHQPLLLALLSLGQRKSWTNWQRQELERWIGELIGLLSTFSLIDAPLQDAIARYDAFRLGVELDEDDGAPLGEQLSRVLQAHEDEQREQQQDHLQDMENGRDALIEELLDKTLGKRPGRGDSPTGDFFEQEPGDVESEAQAAYDQERAEMRNELETQFQRTIDEMMGEFLDEGDDDYDYADDGEEFTWGFPGAEKPAHSKSPLLDSATVQRMFRSAAAVLHPDREPDADKRLVKQGLMAELLIARKSGDVMAVLSLYQEHVSDGETLSKDEEKKLTTVLEQQIRELKIQYEDYQPSSNMHSIAWDFYHPAKSKVDKEIAKHLKQLTERAQLIKEESALITSMRTLKPLLEIRYEQWQEQAPYYY